MVEYTLFVGNLVLLLLTFALIPASYRVIKGPSNADRLQSVDVITNLLIGIIVVLGLVRQTSFLIDVAIALSALAFIGTLAMARYLSQKQVF